MSEIPADLRYTAEHEWVRRTGDGTVRVGITDFAQSSLGDVVYVAAARCRQQVTAGESFGEVESTKSVSDLYAPVTAKVIAVNGDLESNPQLVNSDPYGEGLADGARGRRRYPRAGAGGAARCRCLSGHIDLDDGC